MNLINRIVVTFVLLLLAGAAISIIALAWTIPTDSIDWLRDAVTWLGDNNEDMQKVLLTTAGALVALVALSALVLEYAPSAGPAVRVTDVKAGEAVLTSAAIGQRVEEEVRAVEHIAEVRASIRPRRKGVEVFLDLHVDPQANLATVADEACEAARRVLSEKVHVELAKPPSVRLHYRELRLQRAMQGRQPEPPASPPPPPVADPPEAESPGATPPIDPTLRQNEA